VCAKAHRNFRLRADSFHTHLQICPFKIMAEDIQESLRLLLERNVNSDHEAIIDKQAKEAGAPWFHGYKNRVATISGFFELAKQSGEFSPEESYIQGNVNRMLRELKEAEEKNQPLPSEEERKRLIANLNVLQRREETNG